MSEINRITPDAFDAMLKPGERKLWGAKQIAAVGGVSEDTVRRSWARDDACPVWKCGGRYFSFQRELVAWMSQRA